MSSSRRSSVSSVDSITNQSTPLLGPAEQDEPSPTLVLVHDEEAQNESFDFLSDDDLEDDFSTQVDRLGTSPIPLLSPTLIFLYLLTPYLKLGAMFLPSTDLALSRSVPALLIFALFSAAARYMWYMLAKYIGRADLEEIVLDAFARSRSHEQRRSILRGLVRETSNIPPNAVIAVAEALTLLLAIPCLVITTPPLPIPGSLRRLTKFPISKFIVYLVVVVLSLLSTSVSAILSDILLILALSSTYVLPALLHITIHEFHSPLSIVLPNSSPSSPVSPSDAADELLQRKERTLQRRRLTRRMVWDVCAWLMLLPVGGGGTVWAIGRIAGKW
ncbi:hypothetical protein EWM64_g3372 [Hericium alpestre]|uniref:Uncharacterized protein n=1 Tax=Hericium alpestre TaxID=135208 RepID=A0A4Z0A342_9AGAM|nr:hypothetical protein EWM64_g3372 [Hericium alpestre]